MSDNTKGPPREVPASIASSSISSPDSSNIHDEGVGQQDEMRISSNFGGIIRDSRSTPHMAARVTNSGVGVDRLDYCEEEKRGRAPKNIRKGGGISVGCDVCRVLCNGVIDVEAAVKQKHINAAEADIQHFCNRISRFAVVVYKEHKTCVSILKWK
ncbi:hypothetical protein Tco_1196530 [Tanacetum coccineum]